MKLTREISSNGNGAARRSDAGLFVALNRLSARSLSGRTTFCICLLLPLALALANEPGEAEKDERKGLSSEEARTPRETVSEFLRRIKEGRSREAFALAMTNSLVSWSQEFRRALDSDPIQPLHQLGANEHAIVVSNPFPSRGGQEVFYAFLVQRDGEWRLRRSGRATPSEGVWMMKGYQANPDVRVDALPAELIGEWWAVCDSTIILTADGSGTELIVGPGGPVTGQQPEPFEWEVRGSTLSRRFADRQESLEITWLSDDSVHFHCPNDSGWGMWGRRDR
jgi:hypothetical protein